MFTETTDTYVGVLHNKALALLPSVNGRSAKTWFKLNQRRHWKPPLSSRPQVPGDGFPLVQPIQAGDAVLACCGEGEVLLLRPLARPQPHQRGQNIHHVHQARVPSAHKVSNIGQINGARSSKF